MTRKWSALIVITVALMSVSDSNAWFICVDDFECLNPGNVNEQNHWRAAGLSSVITTDPCDGSNQVLAITTESTTARKPLLLLNDTVRMLFFRFRFGEQLNCGFGMSDSSVPSQFGDFEVQLDLSNSSFDLRVNDDGTFDELTILTADTWYNCWLLIDNYANNFQVYLNNTPEADAAAEDLLTIGEQSSFVFRNSTAGDLRSLFIKTGGGNSANSGPLYLDDIYLENTNALNLHNPTAYDYNDADITHDNAVDLFDLSVLVHEWLTQDTLLAADVAPSCPDGVVDLQDFSLLSINWLTSN